MKKLVVLSGGMDSGTLLGYATQGTLDHIETITFNYGSKHNARENKCAEDLARYYGVSNRLVHLPFVNQLFKSALLQSGDAIPEGHYAEENMKQTVVPYRNAIMLSIAAGYASSIDADSLLLGNHAGDHAIYPDCREEFTAPFEQALLKGDWNPVKIERPFEKLSKGDIAVIGRKLRVPYQLTWTCYKGGDVACGVCGSCTERLEAFDFAGLPDPLEYLDRETYKKVLGTSAS